MNDKPRGRPLLDEPPAFLEDRWYWITRDGTEWFPALRDGKNWTNGDTWFDFCDADPIIAWKLIPLPPDLP